MSIHEVQFDKKNTIIFNYSIFGLPLPLVSNKKDLGVIFDSKLNFSHHTQMIKNKTMRNLGFIKITCHSFNDPTALKTLVRSLVRSNLEYCLLIWSNKTLKQNETIESVQNDYLRFIAFKFNNPRHMNI